MISVVVPVYNAGDYILITIETVTAQTYTDWELILVDDCSPDDSVALIEEYLDENSFFAGKIRLIKLEKNAGAAGARNRGIDEAKGRYIAFLDADDIWYQDKLEKQLQFMKKHEAGFVYSAYEFGDEEAIPNGKMVRVPKTMNYKQALTRTIIFTSTVLIDTEKISKELIHMPKIGSEDTATWWNILKEGHTAYGLDQPLVIYRRPATSLSSNKKTAVKRIWNLYMEVAKVPKLLAMWYVVLWSVRASVRRFITDNIRNHVETVKRFTVVQLSVVGIVMYAGIYAWYWFTRLYPILSSPIISRDGYYFGGGLKLYFRGHVLILLIYFAILFFMSNSSGGMRTGYLKPSNIFVSEVMALILTNMITYFQLSLMRNWLMPVRPFLQLFLLQVLLVGVWALITDSIYRHVFPPRETLVLDLSVDRNEGASPGMIRDKFDQRKDRFNVMKVMHYEGDLEKIKKECLRWYGCVVITGGSDEIKKAVMEYCYMHLIRVYLIPDLGDVILQGTEFVDLFDTPVFELREYSARWEERAVKRAIDLLFGTLALVICSPYIVYKLLTGHKVTGDICTTRGNKSFYRYRFDDETGRCGVLSLISVISGKMSIVGTTLSTEKEETRSRYKPRMKPGIMGFYQLYGDPDASDLDILKMDTFYAQHFTLMGDFKLMLQAVRRGFRVN